MPYVAFVVDGLDVAIAGQEVLLEAFTPETGMSGVVVSVKPHVNLP